MSEPDDDDGNLEPGLPRSLPEEEQRLGPWPGAIIRYDRSGLTNPFPTSPTSGEEARPPLLRNPYVLALIGVAGAFGLSVLLVLFLAGNGGAASTQDNAGVAIEALTPRSAAGVAAHSIATATIRDGPGLDYKSLTELSGNKDVVVIGRNVDASWFSIVYPPGSQISGWVPKTALSIPGDPLGLPILSVTPSPVPTQTPTASPEPSATATPTTTLTATPTETPTPSNGPHLIASIVPGTCRLGQRLLVSVRNAGPTPLTAAVISVRVQSSQGDQIFLGTLTATIQPGQAMNIDTTYVVRQPVTVTIEPAGDPNAQDHRVDCLAP